MTLRRKPNQKGFTLIELLVVIAIVGLLASIVLTALNNARKKGRDSKRISDIQTINTAIQLYINDLGHAPFVGSYNCDALNPDPYSCGSAIETNTSMWNQLALDLKPYIAKLPTDPCGVNCWDQSNGIWFDYVYHTPTDMANWCASIGCTLSTAELNRQYSIYAENMEVDSSNYTYHQNNRPRTFGYLNHALGGISF